MCPELYSISLINQQHPQPPWEFLFLSCSTFLSKQTFASFLSVSLSDCLTASCLFAYTLGGMAPVHCFSVYWTLENSLKRAGRRAQGTHRVTRETERWERRTMMESCYLLWNNTRRLGPCDPPRAELAGQLWLQLDAWQTSRQKKGADDGEIGGKTGHQHLTALWLFYGFKKSPLSRQHETNDEFVLTQMSAFPPKTHCFSSWTKNSQMT